MIDSTNIRVIADNFRELEKKAGTGGLPSVTPSDAGKFLAVDNEGKWGLDKPKTGLDYSTNEQDSGLKWIDGKAIYQITKAIITESSGDNIIDATFGTGKNIIGMEGFASVDLSDHNYIFPLPGFPGDSNPLRFVVFMYDENELHVNAAAGGNAVVTFYYTKTEAAKKTTKRR